MCISSLVFCSNAVRILFTVLQLLLGNEIKYLIQLPPLSQLKSQKSFELVLTEVAQETRVLTRLS